MPRLGRDDPDVSLAVAVDAGWMPVPQDLAQAVSQPVDARQGGEGVIDRGREGADGDLDELVDAERDVLGQGAVRAGDVGTPEHLTDLGGGCGRPHGSDRALA